MFRTILDIGKLVLGFLRDTAQWFVDSSFFTTSINDIAISIGAPTIPSDIPIIGTLADATILSLCFGSLMFTLLLWAIIKRVLDIIT